MTTNCVDCNESGCMDNCQAFLMNLQKVQSGRDIDVELKLVFLAGCLFENHRTYLSEVLMLELENASEYRLTALFLAINSMREQLCEEFSKDLNFWLPEMFVQFWAKVSWKTRRDLMVVRFTCWEIAFDQRTLEWIDQEICRMAAELQEEF